MVGRTAGGRPRGVVELRWGLKRSFLDYVSGMPDFTYATAGGVQALPQERAFAFPVADASGSDAGVVAFTGELRFVAHFGVLRVEIADPWLELTADGGCLTVRDLDETGPERGRFRLVGLALAGVRHEGEGVVWHYRAALAAEAVALFGGVYAPGEPFDALAVVTSSGEGIND